MNDSYFPAYRYFVLSVLVVSDVMSFIASNLMTILLDKTKAVFGASGTAMGYLTGFDFAILYAVVVSYV